MSSSTRADGRDALFSAAVRTPGTLVLECRQCRAKSRVTYADLARRSLPLPVWFPWQRYSRLARCPACEQRTWLQEHWRA